MMSAAAGTAVERSVVSIKAEATVLECLDNFAASLTRDEDVVAEVSSDEEDANAG